MNRIATAMAFVALMFKTNEQTDASARAISEHNAAEIAECRAPGGVPVLCGATAVHAQAEQFEAEFVRTKKAVEVQEYDQRGVRTSTWTDTVVVMRHRPTGACWLGTYASDGKAIDYAPVSPAVCK